MNQDLPFKINRYSYRKKTPWVNKRKKTPETDVVIKRVKAGVYLLIISFYGRYGLEVDAHGSGHGYSSIYFGSGSLPIAMEFRVPVENAMITGSMSKNTYLGTIYTKKVWDNIMDSI